MPPCKDKLYSFVLKVITRKWTLAVLLIGAVALMGIPGAVYTYFQPFWTGSSPEMIGPPFDCDTVDRLTLEQIDGCLKYYQNNPDEYLLDLIIKLEYRKKLLSSPS